MPSAASLTIAGLLISCRLTHHPREPKLRVLNHDGLHRRMRLLLKIGTCWPCRPRAEFPAVMHTSRVSSPRYSASRVFFCLETASLYSSPTRLTRLLPQLIFHCATVFYAPRRHSRLLARRPHSPTTLDSPRVHHCSRRSASGLSSAGLGATFTDA
jgi:hypothetical protein